MGKKIIAVLTALVLLLLVMFVIRPPELGHYIPIFSQEPDLDAFPDAHGLFGLWIPENKAVPQIAFFNDGTCMYGDPGEKIWEESYKELCTFRLLPGNRVRIIRSWFRYHTYRYSFDQITTYPFMELQLVMDLVEDMEDGETYRYYYPRR